MGSVQRLFFFSVILLVMNISPAINSFAYAADNTEKVESNRGVSTQQVDVPNPATDLWRAVRQRQFDGVGDINVSSQINSLNAGSLINTEGNQWRQFRRQWLVPYGSYFILGVLGLLFIMTLLIRRVKIPNGQSGKAIPRMSSMQRISHWLMVFLIGFMALTGLLLLFGRFVIIPLIGADAFSPFASASKEGHNLFGPLVIVSLLLMLIYFIRYNWPAKGDLKWLLTAGGLFSKKHLKIGFFNAGEKLLFWGIIILLIVLSVTGMLLLFPYYEQTIDMTQLALIIHAIAALLLIALAFGHIWMVRTVEGTLGAMTSGDVDENWVKAHHSKWYEEVKELPASEDNKTGTTEAIQLNDDLSNPDQKGAY